MTKRTMEPKILSWQISLDESGRKQLSKEKTIKHQHDGYFKRRNNKVAAKSQLSFVTNLKQSRSPGLRDSTSDEPQNQRFRRKMTMKEQSRSEMKYLDKLSHNVKKLEK